jgi:hypothetical protein
LIAPDRAVVGHQHRVIAAGTFVADKGIAVADKAVAGEDFALVADHQIVARAEHADGQIGAGIPNRVVAGNDGGVIGRTDPIPSRQERISTRDPTRQ